MKKNELIIINVIWEIFLKRSKDHLTEEELSNTREITYQPACNGNKNEWVLVAGIENLQKNKNFRKKIYLEEDVQLIDSLFNELRLQTVVDSDVKEMRKMSEMRKAHDIDVFKIGRFYYYEDSTNPSCMVFRISPYKSIIQEWVTSKIKSKERENLLSIMRREIYLNRKGYAY